MMRIRIMAPVVQAIPLSESALVFIRVRLGLNLKIAWQRPYDSDSCHSSDSDVLLADSEIIVYSMSAPARWTRPGAPHRMPTDAVRVTLAAATACRDPAVRARSPELHGWTSSWI